MTRVKGGPQGHLRHKKILKITKGQRGAKNRLFKRANEAMLKSLWYATRDRRVRKRDLRKLWIARINAAARLNGTTYSKLVAALKKASIDLNRKMFGIGGQARALTEDTLRQFIVQHHLGEGAHHARFHFTDA